MDYGVYEAECLFTLLIFAHIFVQRTPLSVYE